MGFWNEMRSGGVWQTAAACLSAITLSSCGGAATPALGPQEQPALVVLASPPSIARSADPVRGTQAPPGSAQECTELLHTIREVVGEVSEAYTHYERTGDLQEFEKAVREAANKSTARSFADPRLRDLSLRYRAALLGQIDEARGKADKGEGAVAEEGTLLDELTDYCGL